MDVRVITIGRSLWVEATRPERILLHRFDLDERRAAERYGEVFSRRYTLARASGEGYQGAIDRGVRAADSWYELDGWREAS